MVYSVQEQVNSLEEQGIGALTKQLQQNPKLVVGIALENLQKDMQEDERAKQIGGGDTGLPIIDKKLASLSGGPSGQRDAMAAAGPGLQQRGQQLQSQQLLKSLFQAAKTPGGMPAAMAQSRGAPGGGPPQRMAMGGIAGYARGGEIDTAGGIGRELDVPESTYPWSREPRAFLNELRQDRDENEDQPTRTWLWNADTGKAMKKGDPWTHLTNHDPMAMTPPPGWEPPLRPPANVGKNQPIPALMEKYGSEMVMEFLEGEKELRAESQHVAPEYADAYKQKRDNFYSHYPQGFLEELYETREGSIDISEDLSMAHGGIVGYANRGLVSSEDVDMEVLMDAIREVESGGNPNADSGYAYGAYQIGPEAGSQPGYGVDPIDVYNSTEEEQRAYSRDYLKAMLGEFGGDLEPALQAYNVGPNALNQIRAGERDMPAETSDYYSKVMEEYGDRTMPQDEDFVPLASVEDQGMVSKAVSWAKENPLEAASLGLMFVPGVGWGMAGARGAMAVGSRLIPRGIAAAKQALGPGSRFGRAVQKPFTKPITSGPGSAVRDPSTGRMRSARDADDWNKWLRKTGPAEDIRDFSVPLNRAFSPGRTAGTVGAAGFTGANLGNLREGTGEATQAPADFWGQLASQQAEAQQSDADAEIALLTAADDRRQEKEAGASRAGRYIGMQGDTQDKINRADDPARTLRGIDTNREFEAPNRGIMSQAPSQFRSNRDRFAQAIGPEAVEAIQQNQRRRAEPSEEYAPGAEPSEEYAPGIGGDAREIGDYLKRVFGFQEGGTVDGEEIIPLKDVPDEGGRISGIVDWAKENPELAISAGLMFVPGLGWGYAGTRAAMAVGSRLIPRGIAAARQALGPGSRAHRWASKPFTKTNQMPKGWKGMADPGRPYLRGKKGWEAATSPQARVQATRARQGAEKMGAWTKPSLAKKMGLNPNDPKVAAELAKIRSGGGSTFGSSRPTGKHHMTPGTPAVAARDPLVNPRVFSPARTTGTLAGSAGIVGGLGGLLGGSEDADAVQVPRDTSNLDRGRDFDTEAFSKAYPGIAEQMGQQDTERNQRTYDEGRAAWKQQEAERKRKDERGGIMSRVGSALGSPQAQKFYSAMQDLGYGGGAARGQEGAQMMRGLAARDAQNRELQALEDKIGLEGRALDIQQQTSMNDLMAALWGSPSFQNELTRLAEEMDLPSKHPEVRRAAIEAFLGMLPHMPSSGAVGNMPGLDTTTRNELEAYAATP